MNTETKPKRKKKPQTRFIVTKRIGTQDIDCGWGLRREIGTALRYSRGVLVPRPENPAVFTTEFAATRALNRTTETRMVLGGYARDPDTGEIKRCGGSMVDAMPSLQPLLQDGVLQVRAFVQ